MSKELTKDELLELAKTSSPNNNCSACSSLICPGWESVPSSFDLKTLRVLGTLKREGAEECWDEDHPHGTNIWSADAPISIDFHPYNRSDVYECIACQKKYLRYTEYGGYYVDERIRYLNPELIR